ncbi:DUF418 domain-containing protein [Evansella sp. AB-rgal1]|uniref:DUF418 domain-containing protein n=1 Tax=Evansella sp. AB-rgal1 TaxID=3242696 RepID=UPI00359E77E4
MQQSKQHHFVPTAANERIVVLDIIRAFALFGILLVNMRFFSTPAIQVDSIGSSSSGNLFDIVSTWFIFIFAEIKFVSMFSMLFGIGFLLFMERGEEKGIHVKKFFKRRLLVLLLFGLIHIFFFWYGDILTFYALLGFLLLLMKGKQPRSLKRAAIITWSIIVTFFFLMASFMYFAQIETAPAQQVLMKNEVNRVVEVYSQGTFVEILQQRMNDISIIAFGNIFLFGVILTMFFFGMYFWKTGIFTNTAENLDRIRRIAKTMLLVGVLGLILASLGKLFIDGANSPWYFVQYGGLFLSGPSISIFYVMSILLLLQNKDRLAKATTFLQPVGKMALTNYLMQTLLCTTIFYSYGLGLFGSIGPFGGILITVGIYSLQIVYSYFWMKRFQFGTMEWLWRRLTYGKNAVKVQRLKKAQ